VIKYETREVQIKKSCVAQITCDRCQKDMGNDEHQYGGGKFTPSFTWDSRFDSSDYEYVEIVMCDECWELFCETFIFDHIKHGRRE